MDGRNRAPTVREWAAAKPPTNVALSLCSMLGNRRAVVYRTDVVFFIAAGGRDALTTTRGGA